MKNKSYYDIEKKLASYLKLDIKHELLNKTMKMLLSKSKEAENIYNAILEKRLPKELFMRILDRKIQELDKIIEENKEPEIKEPLIFLLDRAKERTENIMNAWDNAEKLKPLLLLWVLDTNKTLDEILNESTNKEILNEIEKKKEDNKLFVIDKTKNLVPNVIRQELNIEQYPIFTTSANKSGKRIIEIKEIEDNYGNTRKGKIAIGNYSEVGVLRVFDYKVLCVLTQMWEQAGKPRADIKVYFTMNNLAKRLGFSHNKRGFSLIRKSLTRLVQVPICWENSFKRKGDESPITSITDFIFLPVCNVFKQDKKRKKFFEKSYFSLSPYIVKNLENRYSKPLLLSAILSLKSEIAVLLYSYLDRMLYKNSLLKISTRKIFEDLALTEYTYKSDRKRKLELALNELKTVCFYSFNGKIDFKFQANKIGDDWNIIIRKTARKELSAPENTKYTELIEWLSRPVNNTKNWTKKKIENTINKKINEYGEDKIFEIAEQEYNHTVFNFWGRLKELKNNSNTELIISEKDKPILNTTENKKIIDIENNINELEDKEFNKVIDLYNLLPDETRKPLEVEINARFNNSFSQTQTDKDNLIYNVTKTFLENQFRAELEVIKKKVEDKLDITPLIFMTDLYIKRLELSKNPHLKSSFPTLQVI